MAEMTNKQSTSVWDGVYASFAEAGGEDTVFEDKVWLGKIIERARSALERARGGAIPPVASTTEYALPFVAALAAPENRPLRILDFGGGMATSYVPLRAMLPSNRALDFVVVENETVCRAGRELFKDSPNLTFLSDLPHSAERFDMVHFGSSLHYVDDWKGVLGRVTAYEPLYILFADLPAADNKSFMTTQLFHGRRIPVRFWSLQEFVSEIAGLNYELIFQARYQGPYLAPGAELPTANFDDEHRLTYTTQLVFRRAGTVADVKGF